MAISDRDYEKLNSTVYDTALGMAQNGAKPVYSGTYEQQLGDLYDKIQNREKFSYDVNADPLYDLYKDRYIQQGKLAMKDTMGQAAALTGGYGNTYGQSVGQQAYDAYLQNLSDVIPQLYGMAYDQYQDEGDRLKDLYGMAGQMRDAEYGRYRDDLSDYEYGQQVARQMEAQEYERRTSEENTAYNRRIQEENTAYARQQDARKNLMALISSTGYSPTAQELAAAGMSAQEAAAVKAEFDRARMIENFNLMNSGSSGGGGGRSYGGGGSGGSSRSSGGGYGDSGYTTADIVAGNSNAIAAAAAGYAIANSSGGAATERQIVDAIDYATNRNKAGSYAYKPNKNARNY